MKKFYIILLILIVLIVGFLIGGYYNQLNISKTEAEIQKNSSRDNNFDAVRHWRITKIKDDFTDKTKTVVFYDSDTITIQISRETPSFWLYITSKSGPMFESYGELEFRVDKRETKSFTGEGFKLLEKYGPKIYYWEPRTIGLHIYHGENKKSDGTNVSCGMLSELMSGKELKVRYQVDSFSKHTLNVNIEELKPLLIQAFGVDYCEI